MLPGTGSLEVVKLLLDRGADINAKNNSGGTALMVASGKTFFWPTETFAQTGRKALVVGSGKGHLEVVKLLLDRGADVNAKAKDGDTALMSAAGKGHPEIVERLFNSGADINAKRTDGFTPLMVASSNGRLEILKLLLGKGADVNAKSENGFTPLMVASSNGRLEILKLLLDKGADVNAKAKDGGTALTTAYMPMSPVTNAPNAFSEKAHLEVVNLLKAHGAKE